MPLEGASGCKLSELVTDHILSDVDGQEAATVVHIEVKADEVGSDC